MTWRQALRAHVKNPLDVASLLLLSPGIAALVFSISNIRTLADLARPSVGGFLLLAAVLIAGFIRRALTAVHPLLDLRLFAGRTFSASAAVTFTLAIASFGAQFLLPLYLQGVRSGTVLVSGLFTVPQAVGMTVAITFSGHSRTGSARVGWSRSRPCSARSVSSD